MAGMAVWKRNLYLVAGGIAVLLGLIGMLVPVLPTTPFLLLAAFFFGRSSDRALAWLLNHRWFGRSLRNYREGRRMSLRDKVITLGLLWLTIGLSAWLLVESPWARLAMVAVALGVTAHLARLRGTAEGSAPARELPEPDGG